MMTQQFLLKPRVDKERKSMQVSDQSSVVIFTDSAHKCNKCTCTHLSTSGALLEHCYLEAAESNCTIDKLV